MSRGTIRLRALDLVTGGTKPERKPRRKSLKALVEAAKRAGLDVSKLNADGSIEIGKKTEGEEPKIFANSNPWDEVLP